MRDRIARRKSLRWRKKQRYDDVGKGRHQKQLHLHTAISSSLSSALLLLFPDNHHLPHPHHQFFAFSYIYSLLLLEDFKQLFPSWLKQFAGTISSFSPHSSSHNSELFMPQKSSSSLISQLYTHAKTLRDLCMSPYSSSSASASISQVYSLLFHHTTGVFLICNSNCFPQHISHIEELDPSPSTVYLIDPHIILHFTKHSLSLSAELS